MKVFALHGAKAEDRKEIAGMLLKALEKRNYTTAWIVREEGRARGPDEAVKHHEHLLAGQKKAHESVPTTRQGTGQFIRWGSTCASITLPGKRTLNSVLQFIDADYVLVENDMESNMESNIPVAAIGARELDGQPSTFATLSVDAFRENKTAFIETLADDVVENVFEVLPDFPEDCCTGCGMSCRQLCAEIVQGRRSRNDCILSRDNISLRIDGKAVDMVPFVKRILRNAVIAVVSELDGYRENGYVEITMGRVDDGEKNDL